MPRRKTNATRSQLQQGQGIFQDIGRGLKKASQWLKKNKAISRVGSLADQLGVPHAGAVSRFARQQGYGKRKKAVKRKSLAIRV